MEKQTYFNQQLPIMLVAMVISRSIDKCKTLEQIHGCKQWIKNALYGRYPYHRASVYATPLYSALAIKEVFLRSHSEPIEEISDCEFETGQG